MRVPREGPEVVRRCARAETPDLAIARYAAIELGRPALAAWIDRHPGEYGRGLLDGFEAEE